MREKISIALVIVISALLAVGFISLIALGITTVTGGLFPFGFAFLIASVLIVVLVMTSVDNVEVTQ